MNPALIKYGSIALAALLWTGAVYVYATNHEARVWKAAIAEQKAEAAAKLTELTERARKKENEDAENARNVEAVYNAMLADAFDGRDDFARRLRIARRGASCGGTGSSAPVDTGRAADVASGGEVGLGQPVAVDPLLQARDGVKALVAYTVACHQRITEIGR